MPRFTLRLAILLLPLFTLLAIVMSALGSTQPIHPALRGFVEGCEGVPQPCWYGIVPGMNSDEALQIVQGLVGYKPELEPNRFFYLLEELMDCELIRLNTAQSETIVGISFIDCQDLAIGDVMEFYPRPKGLQICQDTDDILYFEGGVILFGDNENLSPRNSVNNMVFHSALSYPNTWHGFIAIRQYIELEPAQVISICG